MSIAVPMQKPVGFPGMGPPWRGASQGARHPQEGILLGRQGNPEGLAALPEQTRQVEGRPSESRFNLAEVSPEGKISAPVGWVAAWRPSVRSAKRGHVSTKHCP